MRADHPTRGEERAALAPVYQEVEGIGRRRPTARASRSPLPNRRSPVGSGMADTASSAREGSREGPVTATGNPSFLDKPGGTNGVPPLRKKLHDERSAFFECCASPGASSPSRTSDGPRNRTPWPAEPSRIDEASCSPGPPPGDWWSLRCGKDSNHRVACAGAPNITRPRPTTQSARSGMPTPRPADPRCPRERRRRSAARGRPRSPRRC